MTELAPDFELANVGPGADPCSLRVLAAEGEFVVLLFQRDFYCTNCRKQIQAVKERYDEFTERGDEPTVAWSYAGKSTFDRPEIDDLLAELDRLREAEPSATDDA
jgi:hypothetical protein